MTNKQSHHRAVDRQFADQANAYLGSAVHTGQRFTTFSTIT